MFALSMDHSRTEWFTSENPERRVLQFLMPIENRKSDNWTGEYG